MCSENCHICLFINNFSGHFITYEPWNICLEFLEPNMTSFMQPLDAGIIWCFKVHYCHGFCSHAIQLDDLGECNIYKINLLEVMCLACKAWKNVNSTTLQNCWTHTGIWLKYVYQPSHTFYHWLLQKCVLSWDRSAFWCRCMDNHLGVWNHGHHTTWGGKMFGKTPWWMI